MLKILEIKLQADFGGKERLEKPLGVIMNELLFRYADADYREMILPRTIKPYTQSMIFSARENIYKWKITALNTEAAENILYRIKDALPAEVFLNEYGIDLKIWAKNYIHSATYRQLVEKYFAAGFRSKKIDWEFITPTIFYGNNEYAVLPQPVNLMDNLICIWNLFAGENILQEQNLYENLARQINVLDYDFKIKPAPDDGRKVPSLTGIYRLGLKNNIMAKKIICILSEYVQYCGIGKKTDLGYGCVKSTVFRK